MGNCLRSFLSRISDGTLEQKVRRAQRVSLIQLLPTGIYDHGKDGKDNVQECVICLMDLVPGNTIRCLPCMHLFHVDCIDEWLMCGTTCPCCRWPVLVTPRS